MMSLEIIVFIASILFGIILYWRESKSNKIYRFFNKIFNSKSLQMKSSSKKGFLFQQSFLWRLVNITLLFLIVIMVVRFIIPIDLATLSLFTSSIFGTLCGTYLAHFIFKSSEVIDDKGDSIIDAVRDTVEKGKEFIQDIETKESSIEENIEPTTSDTKSDVKKSARDRLKDKGYM